MMHGSKYLSPVENDLQRKVCPLPIAVGEHGVE